MVKRSKKNDRVQFSGTGALIRERKQLRERREIAKITWWLCTFLLEKNYSKVIYRDLEQNLPRLHHRFLKKAVNILCERGVLKKAKQKNTWKIENQKMLKNLRVNFLQSVLGERNAWDAAALNDRLRFEGYPIDMLLRDINELRRKELKLSFTEQKIDLTKSLPRNIISNRENFIKEIEKTWSQITKKQGKEFFSDPKALTGGSQIS